MTKNEKGVTLMELLVGIALSSFIFVASTQVAVAIFNLANEDKHVQKLLDTKSNLQADITNTARWAQSISLGPNTLIVDGVEYKLIDKRIYKDGSPFTSNEVEISSFETYTHPTGAELEVVIEMHYKGTGSANEVLRLIVSNRSNAFE